MSNINIVGCEYGHNHLLDAQDNSIIGLKDGIIEKNAGRWPIIHVNSNCVLNLDRIIFRNNIKYEDSYNIPTCIKTEKEGKLNINKCEFLNHCSEDYSHSAFIISANGTLNIKSSKFEGNKSENCDARSISVRIEYLIFKKLIIFK